MLDASLHDASMQTAPVLDASRDAAPSADPGEEPLVDAGQPAWPERRDDWPLPQTGCFDVTRCTADGGVPGVRCKPDGPCLQPCPQGMASDAEGRYCNARCTSDADCRKGGRTGKCTSEGLCDRFDVPPLTCDSLTQIECKTARGEFGWRCPDGPCRPACKPGLRLFGGTDCAKPCKSDRDCPGGGECMQGACIPVCPSEGCPYLWE